MAKKKAELTINVYSKKNKNEIEKTCTAQPADLMFGSVRSLMALLNIDDINNTGQLLKTVYNAWEQLTDILTDCFPDMEEGDWNRVRVNELLPVVVEILKSSFGKVLEIPSDSKN